MHEIEMNEIDVMDMRDMGFSEEEMQHGEVIHQREIEQAPKKRGRKRATKPMQKTLPNSSKAQLKILLLELKDLDAKLLSLKAKRSQISDSLAKLGYSDDPIEILMNIL